ncbi:hypothetical protein CSC94_06085 [Zhengella mangrovi]|uniref:Cytoplasmic protein n=1 Tax=Zhengella mangrovi TaxID=1982044 RepID=A0A2G1QRV1_9HYPH|nr:hypothetical protein [Zhengella mangrovi]PHP68219.1 hypothetical protein CSC94_06085 [Zhengella mangrovi]
MLRTAKKLLSAALLAAAFAAPAAAFDQVGHDARCDDARVLDVISAKFAYQVRHVPHLPDVDIVSFDRVHQRRHVQASKRNATVISRRYCKARAHLSDGRHRSVWYMIEDGMGFAGAFGDGVQFCVAGFDRWKVYNAWCRVVR